MAEDYLALLTLEGQYLKLSIITPWNRQQPTLEATVDNNRPLTGVLVNADIVWVM
jgi:hypothetical protein